MTFFYRNSLVCGASVAMKCEINTLTIEALKSERHQFKRTEIKWTKRLYIFRSHFEA